jgi:hypothetical protein
MKVQEVLYEVVEYVDLCLSCLGSDSPRGGIPAKETDQSMDFSWETSVNNEIDVVHALELN